MVSTNETALRENERLFLQKARLALRLFEREMRGLAKQLSPLTVEPDSFAASAVASQVTSVAIAQTILPLY